MAACPGAANSCFAARSSGPRSATTPRGPAENAAERTFRNGGLLHRLAAGDQDVHGRAEIRGIVRHGRCVAAPVSLGHRRRCCPLVRSPDRRRRGTIGFDGEQSCGPAGRRDRFARQGSSQHRLWQASYLEQTNHAPAGAAPRQADRGGTRRAPDHERSRSGASWAGGQGLRSPEAAGITGAARRWTVSMISALSKLYFNQVHRVPLPRIPGLPSRIQSSRHPWRGDRSRRTARPLA